MPAVAPNFESSWHFLADHLHPRFLGVPGHTELCQDTGTGRDCSSIPPAVGTMAIDSSRR